MDSQASRYKEAILEVLLKRIVPLEKQLLWQSEVIDELTQSLQALSKMLSIPEEKSVKSSAHSQSSRDEPKTVENKSKNPSSDEKITEKGQ